MLHEHFGKDQYQSLVRQLFRIKQLGTIAEYIEQFSNLVDQLLTYESVADPLFFSTRFVDGLRDDIRAVVLVQRPSDLDNACILALLQEEVANGGIMPCSQTVLDAEWTIWGCQFNSNSKYCLCSPMTSFWVWIGWRVSVQ